MKIFLDNASTTSVLDSIAEKLPEMVKDFYNSSSAYEYAKNNMQAIEEVKEKVANMINCDSSEIIFTSCCSESNSQAIDGFIKRHVMHEVVCGNMEHSSIYNNPNIDAVIKCDQYGFYDPKDFEGYNKTLFAVSMVNNELGTMQNVVDIAKAVHSGHDNYLLVDCAASFGKFKIDVKELGADMISASGNKIGSLKGVGILYVKDNAGIDPIVYGTQNNNLRGGTLNDLAIKTLGMAIDEVNYNIDYVKNLKDYLITEMIKIHGNILINGSLINGSPYILNIYISNVTIDNQQIVSLLDTSGYMISAGSSCHSGSTTPSHVLKAIGLSDDMANHCIRISLGHQNTKEDIKGFVGALKAIINMYKV